ncbi:MAG: hypothetical protein HC845_02625 [Akkermansiaceae bacterium]|nr:hypothetical protein [Akkermansiaceae bacterium]
MQPKMAMSHITIPLLLGLAFGLVSCATPPQAIAVAQTAVEKKEEPVVPAPVATPLVTEVVKNPLLAEIRTPDMLKMPSENELRSSTPVKPKEEAGTGAVVSRPSVETIANPVQNPPPATQ